MLSVLTRFIINYSIMKMVMKTRSYPEEKNRPWLRHRHKYSKSKKCHGKMISTCNKQHLSNIWGSIH